MADGAATNSVDDCLLSVESVSRRFGDRTAVRDVSFSVGRSEIFGLLGPNGAGKSTTTLMISGVLKPDTGAVRINGTDIRTNPRRIRAQMGFVPQDLAIYECLTARQNLRFFGSLYGLSGKLLHDRSEEALQMAGLQARADSFAGEFSGGMKRRLNFAAAIMHRPSLLVLDEPTVGVDPQSRSHLMDCVRRLGESGTAVIYVSHYMEEVEALCSRAAIIDQGTVLCCAAIPELLSRIPRRIDISVRDLPVDFHSDEPAEIIRQDDRVILRLSDTHGESEAEFGAGISRVMAQLAAVRSEVISIRTMEPSLERLFLRLTGTQLRD